MRRLDPRPWNLLPTALLLAAACGPPGIPFDESDDDIADDPDGPEDAPGECVSSADCAPGYYCAGDVCLPEPYSDDYSDWSDYSDDYTDYSDYSDDYTDWDDDYTDYSDYDDGPWYECYSDYDCPPDYACVYNYCQPNPPGNEPIECEGPGIAEIPLPDLGTVLDIQFADVDGDDDDELVVLRADDVAVVQDDDALVSSPWSMPPPVPLRQIALLQLDDDGALDLVAFPDVLGPAIVALGDGSGDFTSLGEMANSPIIDRPIGFDGDLDGIDRLLALRPDIDRIAQFSDPTSLSGNNILIGPAGASDLDLMRLDSMLAPDVLIGVGCAASVRTGVGLMPLEFIADPELGVGLCEWQAVAFTDGDADQPLLVFSQGSSGILRRWDLGNDLTWQVNLPIGPTSSAAANLDGTGDYLLLTDPGDGRMVWAWNDDEPACIAALPFVGSLQFAVGDRNGDGSEDVATLDNSGVVKLWSVP